MEQIHCEICIGGISLEFNGRLTDVCMTIPPVTCSADYTCFIKEMKSAGIDSAHFTQKVILNIHVGACERLTGDLRYSFLAHSKLLGQKPTHGCFGGNVLRETDSIEQ